LFFMKNVVFKLSADKKPGDLTSLFEGRVDKQKTVKLVFVAFLLNTYDIFHLRIK